MTQYKGTNVADMNVFAHALGNGWVKDETATPTAALATTDTIDLMRVPRGVRLQELFKTNGDFDTGTTLQYKLGYRKVDSSVTFTDDDDYFAAAGATDLQAPVTGAAPTRYAFAPITFTTDVFITLTPTANATGVSGTPSITLYARGEMVGAT
jgi:hypothetical protein